MYKCRFCEILEHPGIREVSDTVLYENDNFFVIPTLGCLVKNYILIVSKRHEYSMCSLNEYEKKDLNDLTNKFRMLLKEKHGFFPIVFEHGASRLDMNRNAWNRSACCVLHAHIHLVPLKLNCQVEMCSTLELSEISGFEELQVLGKDKHYLSFLDNSGKTFFRDASGTVLPTQIIRQWIAKDIETASWDWRQHPFEENIIATIDELKYLIKNNNLKKNQKFKYVYYCRAMDGLPTEEILKEYRSVEEALRKNGRVLVNPFEKDSHSLEMNKDNANMIIHENMKNISRSDCVIVNLSIPNHFYVGCIGEMTHAKMKGCFVITVVGDSGADKHFYTLHCSDVVVKTLDEAFGVLRKDR